MSAGHPTVLDLGKYTRRHEESKLLEHLDRRYEKKTKVNLKEKFLVCWKTLLSLLYYFFYSIKISYNVCKFIIILGLIFILITVLYDFETHLLKLKAAVTQYSNGTIPL